MLRSFKMLALASTIVCCSAMAEKIANPTYAAWKKAGKGASVTLVSKSEMMGTTSETEMKSTLVEITDEKAVIEIKTTANMGGQKMEMPASKIEIPASAEGTPAPTGDKPADVKSTTSEAEVTVPAGKFKCKVTETNTDSNGTKTHSKVYTCDEVPGSVVKMESSTEGQVATKTVSELTKIEKP